MIARRIPNLLVPGTQKSGTTFLCAHLRRHPKIYFAKPKEPHFFNKQGIGDADFHRYLEEFFPESAVSAKGEGLMYLAEGSTTYFQSDVALDNVLRYLGNHVRAIICLRHPVEKAVSFYLHNWRRGRLAGTERLLDVDAPGMSIYKAAFCAPHANRWIKALGRERVLFLRYDLLREDSLEFVRQATEFLEIEVPRRVETRKINMGFALKLDGESFSPVIEPSDLIDDQVVPRFLLSDLEHLLKLFKDDIIKTEKTIGVDLSGWKTLPRFDDQKAGGIE